MWLKGHLFLALPMCPMLDDTTITHTDQMQNQAPMVRAHQEVMFVMDEAILSYQNVFTLLFS